MKICKTQDEFVDYMWKLYPNDNQLELRTAMLKAFDFLIGKYDQEQKERAEVSEKIKQSMIEKGFKF